MKSACTHMNAQTHMHEHTHNLKQDSKLKYYEKLVLLTENTCTIRHTKEKLICSYKICFFFISSKRLLLQKPRELLSVFENKVSMVARSE